MADEFELEGPEPREWKFLTLPGAPVEEGEPLWPELNWDDLPKLKALPGCCEEASVLSSRFYIPCNHPATHVVKFPSEGPYRMCWPCSCHNVDNRGATRVGPYVADE